MLGGEDLVDKDSGNRFCVLVSQWKGLCPVRETIDVGQYVDVTSAFRVVSRYWQGVAPFP